MLLWSQQFEEVVWLDSNDYDQHYTNFDAALAVDAFTSIRTDHHDGFEKLKDYQTYTQDWIFGYLAYDLKNDVEQLTSNNYDGLEFPDLYFFQPKKLFLIKDDQLTVSYIKFVDDEWGRDFECIDQLDLGPLPPHENVTKLKLRIHKDAYFKKVNILLDHIRRGDIYESNFCQEFYAEDIVINPLDTYLRLNEITKAPFACFLKCGEKYLLSASPERYLKKESSHIIAQPIKGTAKRSNIAQEDERLKKDLEECLKERSENTMIVDLIRNDLSKTALKGSVTVDELCKVYTFKQVHQMISTISSEVKDDMHPVDVIKSTFPMGSMTGAPKISAMKLIEHLEETKRGLYSGAVGYFTPNNDFDFNVVIRSILYNQSNKYVSFSVGSAITAKSDVLKEYEECLIKGKAMREVLEH